MFLRGLPMNVITYRRNHMPFLACLPRPSDKNSEFTTETQRIRRNSWKASGDSVSSLTWFILFEALGFKSLFALVIAVSAMALIEPATAVPVYNIVPLGLDDLEHTRNDGYKFSYANFSYANPTYALNEAGQVIGYSERYNGGSTQLGYSAWLYDGATTIDIGLTGSEHTFSDGSKRSTPYQLNEAGQVSGLSWRYNGGSTHLGSSAWLYDGVTTIDIGLTGSEHTRGDGFKQSGAGPLNKAGQVLGYSIRFNGGTDLGYSVWLYDGATTINVGLTGSEHTRSDGYKYSDAGQLNEAGQVSGHSCRYNGGSTFGESAWLYDGTTTIEIGLAGSEHTRNDGYKQSTPHQLNEAGQVSGYSTRYNGGTYLGLSAWLYDGATTIHIGLTGSEHTRNDGYKLSGLYFEQLNEAGQVIGAS